MTHKTRYIKQVLKDKTLRVLALEIENLLNQPSIREVIIRDYSVTNLNVLAYWVESAKELLKDEE